MRETEKADSFEPAFLFDGRLAPSNPP